MGLGWGGEFGGLRCPSGLLVGETSFPGKLEVCQPFFLLLEFFFILATSSDDAVFKPAIEAARKQWGKPQVTQIISALGNAKLQTATTTLGPDEPDAAKKPQLPVVTQPPVRADASPMGATVTVQSPTSPPLLGVTVVKSPTSDSPKTVIVKKDEVAENKEEQNSKVQATITKSQNTEDVSKKTVALETISEGTKEGEKGNGTIKVEESEDMSVDDLEDVTEKMEVTSGEKPAPKSPVKAWGELKASTPTEGRFLVLIGLLSSAGLPRTGKLRGKIGEKSGNCVSNQGISKFYQKVSEKSGLFFQLDSH